MYLLIGADLVPTKSNYELFETGDIDTLLGKELKKCIREAEYKIFNLEVPLTNTERPIPKCGPNLIAPTRTIAFYKKIGVNALTLANNHCFDQGSSGLESTCKTLREAGITCFGAGKDLNKASEPHYFDFAGKRIGVYACCEHEFGFATKHSPGANPFDPLESPDHICAMKAECDYAVVLYHGGRENYRYPSPNLQKTCRKIVEKGADLVICQHSHCIGCAEKYQGGTIVYGQGNFLFDRSEREGWKTSLLVSLNEKFELSYVPLKKVGNTVRLALGAEGDEILSAFAKRSEEILCDGFVEEKYDALSAEVLDPYLFTFSGMKRSFFYRVFDKLSNHRMTPWLLKKKYTKERVLALQNYIECEAHREALLCGLKNEKK